MARKRSSWVEWRKRTRKKGRGGSRGGRDGQVGGEGGRGEGGGGGGRSRGRTTFILFSVTKKTWNLWSKVKLLRPSLTCCRPIGPAVVFLLRAVADSQSHPLSQRFGFQKQLSLSQKSLSVHLSPSPPDRLDIWGLTSVVAPFTAAATNTAPRCASRTIRQPSAAAATFLRIIHPTAVISRRCRRRRKHHLSRRRAAVIILAVIYDLKKWRTNMPLLLSLFASRRAWSHDD